MIRWKEQVFTPRRHDYALVIPVINEGERIRRQLGRIAALAPDVDIIIADGGSSDGSLDPDFLRSVGVRALLIKTSPGKLSAQLRMAYRWALDEGYRGIVTVDGNDKDGVGAIPRFVAALEDGFDYVQGSRYLPGGEAINTPPDRRIAGRLIHAPLLSLGAGHRFTDTTNGFRGYSSAYLADPRVAPFRELFGVYSLLFYLTVRATRLGYRVTEIPVVRAYPKGEKTPTKIGGMRSRLALLGEALNAATGAYTPEAGPPQHRFPALAGAGLALVAALVAILAAFTWALDGNPRVTPDSWTLFELARSIPHDFYRVHHVRSFERLSAYSSSFPPLWPALLAAVDRLTGLGIRSGIYAAMLLLMPFALVSEAAARRLFGTRWIGFAAAVLVTGHAGFYRDAVAGRTLALQMLLLAGMLRLLAKPPTRVRAVLLGLLAGAALMNRFDALLLVVVLGVVVAVLARSVASLLCYALAALAAASPWIYYSRLRFGRWFASDSSLPALATDRRAYVTDWWPSPPETLFDAPAAWLLKAAVNAARALFAFLTSPGPLWVAWAVPVVAIVVGFVVVATAPSTARTTLRDLIVPKPVVGLAVALCALLPAYVATGYLDNRYFTPHWWLVLLTGLGFLATQLATREQRDLFGLLSAVGALLLLAVVLFAAQGRMAAPRDPAFPRDAEDAAIGRCLAASARPPILLSLSDLDAARWSALYGWNTLLLPGNFQRLEPSQARQFVARYGVSHIHAPGDRNRALVAAKLPIAALPGCPASIVGVASFGAKGR